jgi:hypothetical protein
MYSSITYTSICNMRAYATCCAWPVQKKKKLQLCILSRETRGALKMMAAVDEELELTSEAPPSVEEV